MGRAGGGRLLPCLQFLEFLLDHVVGVVILPVDLPVVLIKFVQNLKDVAAHAREHLLRSIELSPELGCLVGQQELVWMRESPGSFGDVIQNLLGNWTGGQRRGCGWWWAVWGLGCCAGCCFAGGGGWGRHLFPFSFFKAGSPSNGIYWSKPLRKRCSLGWKSIQMKPWSSSFNAW